MWRMMQVEVRTRVSYIEHDMVKVLGVHEKF